MNRYKIKNITNSAVIAAVYIVLTLLSNLLGLSSGVIQFRFSEVLCILPCFTFDAVPGLFIGCFISNLITGASLFDILFGTLATLIAALLTYFTRKNKIIASLFPTIINTIVITPILIFVYQVKQLWIFCALGVFIGELICATIGGLILHRILQPIKDKLF